MYSLHEDPGSIRLVGEWLVSDDGITRPIIEADVQAADDSLIPEKFLIDSGRIDRSSARACRENLASSRSRLHQTKSLKGSAASPDSC